MPIFITRFGMIYVKGLEQGKIMEELIRNILPLNALPFPIITGAIVTIQFRPPIFAEKSIIFPMPSRSPVSIRNGHTRYIP